ncbi:MAG: phage portal protein [Devosia sp.]|jgi:HK97 family phage portal protein|uniref:phage portal protein n=1 Tax=unclassified Devosia TaxID=196773 RepID=UPI001A04C038|nr:MULTISPECIES: phage portal protein [unclassified Devosia]MBF0680890.1 phage portal protein [Devosia sp.]WEJ32364.1 phage portal protein [Devosia sp. SD17-2]
MSNWISRLFGGSTNAPVERKNFGGQTLMTLSGLGPAQWSGRGYASLVNEGFMRNPVVYRCIRLIAEAATRVPLGVVVDGKAVSEHPLLDLLTKPNGRQSGGEMLEAVYAYLQTAGNAYLQAGIVDGAVRALFVLRPDRMRVVAGADGWPIAYDYSAGGRSVRIGQGREPVPGVLHMALFHPLDDHYGMGPLEAAQTSLDIHNASAQWNKALLDNAARPSGALVYSAGGGNLSEDQFQRLKAELEENFAGAANAGRPMVLEGGLDWKAIALTPRDMDFIEARNAAARDIALAFGVPPMLLGLPGDNTYANMAEANRALWRQTLVPLVVRVAQELSVWLGPAFEGAEIVPDFDAVEALAEDRNALWERVGNAGFLSDAEKRAMVGLGAS